MNENENPRRPVRMCVTCEVLTDAPVLIAEVHQGTGPGFNVYACPQCAQPDEAGQTPGRLP